MLDTTKFIIPGVKDDIGKYSLPPEPKQERKEQLLTGVLEAKPGASASVLPIVISEPVIDNSRQTQVAVSKNSNTKKVFTGGSDPLNNYSLPPEATAEKAISAPGLGIIQIKSPLDAVDTNIMVVKEGDAVSKYSLPPQVQPKLKAQEVTGIIEAKLGAPTSVEPVAVASETMAQESFPLFPPQRDTLATLDTSGVSTNKNATFRSPLDALDTTQMEYDASSIITTYTTPSQLNAKAQMVKGVLVPVVGTPVVVEPLSPDSIARRDADTVKIETPMPEKINSDLPVKNNADNVVNDVAVQNINSNVIADTTTAKMNVDAPFGTNASATDNVKSNFYVAQNGKFSVRFSSSLFYLNVSQLGKVIDYEILSNGRITSNAKSKVVQVGNIKVDYNLDGTMASIAGVPVAYTYDGRVNRVGNVNINYTYGGAMDKVGNVSIFYNGNSTVERIATYRVGYNDKKMVVGIDDSNGLVVFKP